VAIFQTLRKRKREQKARWRTRIDTELYQSDYPNLNPYKAGLLIWTRVCYKLIPSSNIFSFKDLLQMFPFLQWLLKSLKAILPFNLQFLHMLPSRLMVPGQKPSSLRAHPPAPAFQVFSFQVFSIPELGQTANCLCSLRNYKCCQPPETGHAPALHLLPPKAPQRPPNSTHVSHVWYEATSPGCVQSWF